MVFLTAVRLVRCPGPDKFWRRQQLLRMSHKFYGRKRNCTTIAIRYVIRALTYATKGRKLKKINMVKLWKTRLNAGCSEHGVSWPMMDEALHKSNILLNKKVLTDLAIYEPRTFKSLCEVTKKYHNEQGLTTAGTKPPQNVITRGML